VQVQAQILMKSKVLVKNGFMSDKEIRAAHYEPVADVSKSVAKLLTAAGPRRRCASCRKGHKQSRICDSRNRSDEDDLDVETHEPHAHKTGHKWVD